MINSPSTPEVTNAALPLNGLVMTSSDGESRFEVRAENGRYEVRAERLINGVPVRVATALSEANYTTLRSFASAEPQSGPSLEIERKWRPTGEGMLEALDGFLGKPLSSHRIEQGYLVIDATEVRLRRQDTSYFLTLKGGGGLIRREIEIELSEQQAEDLWPATEGRRLEKSRSKHQIMQPDGQATIVEVDRFQGSHAPLVVVECEFASKEAARAFAAPDCFGVEVTESKDHKNKAIVLHGVPLPPLASFSFSRPA